MNTLGHSSYHDRSTRIISRLNQKKVTLRIIARSGKRAHVICIRKKSERAIRNADIEKSQIRLEYMQNYSPKYSIENAK